MASDILAIHLSGWGPHQPVFSAAKGGLSVSASRRGADGGIHLHARKDIVRVPSTADCQWRQADPPSGNHNVSDTLI